VAVAPSSNTWWQTETGGIMITPCRCDPRQTGSTTVPFPGIEAVLLDGEGNEWKVGGGYLAITQTVARNAADDLGRR